jgi:DNA-directed RNA polymerase specialized sigma24 family protein
MNVSVVEFRAVATRIITATLEGHFYGGKPAQQAQHAASEGVEKAILILAKGGPYIDYEAGFRLATKIATDRVIDDRRSNKRMKTNCKDHSLEGESYATPSEAVDLNHDLLLVVDRLDDPQRLAFELHGIHGLTIKQTATVMGCTPSQAKTLFKKACSELWPALRAYVDALSRASVGAVYTKGEKS